MVVQTGTQGCLAVTQCGCYRAAAQPRQQLLARQPPVYQAFQGRAAKRAQWHCHASQDGTDSSEGGAQSSVPDNLPLAGADTDWRAFRARLVASSSNRGGDASSSDVWAHNIPGPEEGCLLIAHPLMFQRSQTYFHLAVIFLFGHGSEGSAGLILNRKTDVLIGNLTGASMLCPEFAECPLYLGGDVGKGTVHVLHGHVGLEESRESVSGVYMGGVTAAQKAVRRGDLDPHSFRWFTQYSGWAPGQLQQEVQAGVWFTAAASKDLILKQAGSSPDAFWHEVLQTMGGEYAQLSAAMREDYHADIMEYTPEDEGKQPEGTSE